MSNIMKFTGKRLVLIPGSIFVLLSLSFGLVLLMPGDPALSIAGSFATDEYLADLRAALGLDQTPWMRYRNYMVAAIGGDLGASFRSGRPVVVEIVEFLPNTLELVLVSLVLAMVGGVSIGSIGGYFQRRWPDRIVGSLITVIQSLPIFVLGIALIYIFYYRLRLVPPPVGRLGFISTLPPRVTGFLFADLILAGDWGGLKVASQKMLLPVATTALVYMSFFAKLARSITGEAMKSAEIEFARAIGLRERRVLYHAVLSGRSAVLTYAAILMGQLVGGAAIVEYVFAWNGVGYWGIAGVLSLDVPVIQGFVIVSGLVTLLTYIVLDLSIVILDPRVTE